MKIKFLDTVAMASAIALAALTSVSARAGTVTIVNLPATGADQATGINPGKHYVCCFDYGNGGASVSINGVPFVHFDPGSQVVNLTNITDTNFGGQAILSSGPSPSNNAACKLARTSNSGQGSLATQADGGMFTLLTDLIYVGSSAPVGSWLRQEYDNLTAGHPYSLRIYYRYWGNTHGDRTQDIYFNGEGTWQPYSGNPFDEDAGGAHFVEYNFTASSTNVICLMTNLVGNGSMMVEGATLEDASYSSPPFITYEPAASGASTNSFVFGVTAIGTAPLAYQWYYTPDGSYSDATLAVSDNVNYSNATTASLTVMTNYSDYYFVIVTNSSGSITSSVVQINPAPVIVTQPTAAKVGNSVVFNVSSAGLPPLNFQWYVNTVSNDTGATALADGNGYSGSGGPSLTATTNFLGYYFVVISNAYGVITSSIVELAAPITAVSAGEPIWNQANQTNVVVTFSDVLDPATAATAANYSLNNGATVHSATLAAPSEVVLGTSVLNSTNAYVLTVQNVKDFYGIVMSPSSTNIPVGTYPANLALWVRADSGVTTDPGTNSVNEWNDLSGNANNLGTAAGFGFEEPVLETNAWGDLVLHFDGTNSTLGTALYANDAPSLEITNDISIIAVVNFTVPGFGNTNGEIVSKTGAYEPGLAAPYDYYVSSSGASLYRGNGFADAWYTAPSGPSAGTPHILAVTELGNTVSHYIDGRLVGTGILVNDIVLGSTFSETNCQDQGQPVFVGGREDETVNHLTGDLAELIVVGSALSSNDLASLDNYLTVEHKLVFLNTSPANLAISASANQLTLSWPANQVGWELQSNAVGLAAASAWFPVPGSTTTNQFIVAPQTSQTNVFYRLAYPPQ